jgi:hypothetical protein
MSAVTVSAPAGDQSDVAGATRPTANVVPTIARSGRRLVETIAGGAERYLERWEDLVHEARASSRPVDESLRVGDALALLPAAKVESDIPGRVRLRLKQLRGRGPLTKQLAAALEGDEGVDRAEVSARTGSVLVHYDTVRYGTRDALLEAVGGDGAQS